MTSTVKSWWTSSKDRETNANTQFIKGVAYLFEELHRIRFHLLAWVVFAQGTSLVHLHVEFLGCVNLFADESEKAVLPINMELTRFFEYGREALPVSLTWQYIDRSKKIYSEQLAYACLIHENVDHDAREEFEFKLRPFCGLL